MERLPNDLWLRIFKHGIEHRMLDHADICSLAITCHHLHQITQEADLWAALLAQNFLFSSVLSAHQHASKALFRTELEKMKEKEREMEEMFDEVMEFVMWLDNNFLDEEETFTDVDDATRGHIDTDQEISGYQSHLAHADDATRGHIVTPNTNRSNRACAKSFWSTVSTILLPKRHY